ncbi:uncharacterized protein GGS22DRAFT_159994 [Annulohypoxylon maeteangense]|uniref:uncharacterized protein n=1 Tax=Annulohypoxylon maeteangense TaxID=1927788 RepID=UPI0020075B3F|nr:uncharacterized protein GGS22DRAFT_159994 [Annulohypoxylon maeteangense]KAI0886127.1 hypothetical protein GGS22DRAFT_159994 [Annulohypoxylon maeteangense]
MAFPPIVTATVQSAVLAATSNLLAQSLTAYQNETSFVIDWIPVFQFVLYAFINVPPNFLWQESLESAFPAYHISPTSATVASPAANDKKALEGEIEEGKTVAHKLSIANTAIKIILDQTVGAVVNTFLFSLFIHSIQEAMDRSLDTPPGQSDENMPYLLSRGAIVYGKVNWSGVIASSRSEFYPILVAGWKLWPVVSLVNFAFIKSIEGRNLVGSLAGVGWGVYMSLVAAR